MYFKGKDGNSLFSSRNGRQVEITDAFPSDVIGDLKAKVVPGLTEDELTPQIPQWPDSDYQGELKGRCDRLSGRIFSLRLCENNKFV